MKRSPDGNPQTRSWYPAISRLLMLVAGCGLLPILACSSLQTASDTDRPRLTNEQSEQAEMLMRKTRMEFSLHRDRQVLDLAQQLRDRFAGYAHSDEVLRLAALSAIRLERYQVASVLVDEFLAEFPHSQFHDEMLRKGAEIATATADRATAVELLIQRYGRLDSAADRADVEQQVDDLLQGITLADLGTLFQRFDSSRMAGRLGMTYTRRLLEAGRFSTAEKTVEQMRELAVDDHWLNGAEALLTGEPVSDVDVVEPLRGQRAVTEAHQIGVICPLTGRYAVFGNAFYDGAFLALESDPAFREMGFELKVEDSASDPVTAALAARRLCEESGSICLIGALRSAPTATVAVVADIYGVPLVSPTATNDHVWQLGAGIFQTNLTGIFDARLLAQLTSSVMLKKRYAVLYPDTRTGQTHYEAFSEEILALGGEIVGAASFSPETTDFRDPINEIKRTRPEVLFVPASVDQMILLGPQLDFYQVGSMVLGPSSWNSPRLLQRTSTVLERCIFAGDNALFPAAWTDDFTARWTGDQYPDEATRLGLRAYQATRLVLDVLAGSQATRPNQLQQALQRRLDSQETETTGPETFAGKVLMFRGEQIINFPVDRFTESWLLTEALAAETDSLLIDIDIPVNDDLDVDKEDDSGQP